MLFDNQPKMAYSYKTLGVNRKAESARRKEVDGMVSLVQRSKNEQ
jgi:hypothetical protein